MKNPIVIAEIGCNHKGDMEIAHRMIKLLGVLKELDSNSYIDAVKFQKRNNKELLSEEEYNAPHPHPENSYGETYGLHREALEFTVEQHAQLKEWCEQEGLVYSTSVWDLTSAKEIVSLNSRIEEINKTVAFYQDLLEKGEITQEEYDKTISLLK